MAATPAKDKYSLRSLHEEISLYDRKLAHLLKYDTFASEQDREKTVDKLTSKRNLLVRHARDLVDAGVEYKLAEVPRSLLTAEQLAEISAVKPANQATTTAPPAEQPVQPSSNTLSSLHNEIQEYLQKRQRGQNHSSAQ